MIKLGQRVRDKITGFQGIAYGRHEWLTGCTTISIKPEILQDGKTISHESFDEPMVEVVDKGLLSSPKVEKKFVGFRSSGGPKPVITKTHQI